MANKSVYNIDQHSHRFAAWAASRAASVKGCRFKVEQGRKILEGCDFNESFSSPEQLPSPANTDQRHREWRLAVIKLAQKQDLSFTHGVAAKLINCYLKSRLICAGHHKHPSVAALHPPIDKLLLEELASVNLGGQRSFWKKYSKLGWSKFSSSDYEAVISHVKEHLGEKPLWMIEEHWVGNQ